MLDKKLDSFMIMHYLSSSQLRFGMHFLIKLTRKNGDNEKISFSLRMLDFNFAQNPGSFPRHFCAFGS